MFVNSGLTVILPNTRPKKGTIQTKKALFLIKKCHLAHRFFEEIGGRKRGGGRRSAVFWASTFAA
jgi:hypothetical protein